MSDPSVLDIVPNPLPFIGHWGYLAIFMIVVLGNLGLPVPEETILALAGYLVWEGHLRLSLVLGIGIVSAVTGDNLGYWLGRRYGVAGIDRYGRWILLTPERIQTARTFLIRHGSLGVFIARFLPGMRFMAGPLAGLLRVPFAAFFVANASGALVFVPTVVGLGYAVGYGFGGTLSQMERALTRVEFVVLILAVLITVILLARRARDASESAKAVKGPR